MFKANELLYRIHVQYYTIFFLFIHRPKSLYAVIHLVVVH